MPILTKAQLEALNQASFPDQTTEAITPQILREYNTATIDSLVDSLATGSFTTDAEFNAFTQSQLSINAALNASTASQQVSINALNTFTQSQDTKNSTLATYTGSNDTKWNTLGGQTGSYVTSAITGSSLVTASFDSGTRNLTFTKGDTSTFAVNIPGGGGTIATGSFATTGSNSFIGDQTITGSVNVSGGEHLFIRRSTTGAIQDLRLGATDNGNNFAFIVTGSDQNPGQQVWGINIGGGQWANSFDAGVVFNSYVTASNGIRIQDGGTFSAPLQQGYVWAGDSNGRTQAVPTSSFGGGGTINTGSFATTGSNNFTGGQTILNGGGINLQSNIEGSGSSFTSITSTIDVTSDPTNVYSSYQLIKPGGETLIAIAANSYTAEYPNATIPYLFGGGNNPGGTNAGIAFPTNGNMDVWKKSSFKYGVELTGSLNLTPASVSTNAQYVIPFISGSTLSKDSVDTIFYNPSSNALQVSASAVGLSALNTSGFNYSSGSSTGAHSTALNKNGFTNVSTPGYYISLSGNPSLIGAPSLTTSTKPGILALSSSSQPYVAIELENSQSFTDGRVTIKRPLVLEQGITGNVNINGNQTISGSVIISGSALNDLIVVGNIRATGSNSSITNTNGAVNGQYFNTTFGGVIGNYDESDFTEIGLALDGNAFTTNWAYGPILYVNNTPGDTYEGVFGFQDKTNYTDGRITALKRLDVSGSLSVSGSTSTTDTITINKSGGNGLVLSNSGINSAGTIVGNNGLNLYNGGGIGISANAEGSGSAYASITTAVDVTSDPTNVFSAYQLVKPGGEALIGIAANSYTAEYSGITIPYLFGGGNNPGGTNAGIAFPTNGQMDVWKKSNFKYGVDVTGSLTIASGSGDLYVHGHKQFNVGAFTSTITQSGSANVSQSIDFNVSDITNGVSVTSNSRLTLANSGTYNIQFSAQVDRVSGSGTDTVYFWLKKNGTNVSNSAGAVTISGGASAAKTITSWNWVVEASANDYYEIVWQTTDANIHLTNITASGNIPQIPSVITTVTQVR
jgi:hypothetical protein